MQNPLYRVFCFVDEEIKREMKRKGGGEGEGEANKDSRRLFWLLANWMMIPLDLVSERNLY
jgi:hypothetical protein